MMNILNGPESYRTNLVTTFFDDVKNAVLAVNANADVPCYLNLEPTYF